MTELPAHLARPWVQPEDAASLIGLLTGVPCTVRTLSTWRSRHRGPPYRKVRGRRVIYDTRELCQWCADSMGDPVPGEAPTRDREAPHAPEA